MSNQLTFIKCSNCGKSNLPPAAVCRRCGSERLFQLSTERGTVYSYTRTFVKPEGWKHHFPYVVGVIRLDDGTLVTALYESDQAPPPAGEDVFLYHKGDTMYYGKTGSA